MEIDVLANVDVGEAGPLTLNEPAPVGLIVKWALLP